MIPKEGLHKAVMLDSHDITDKKRGPTARQTAEGPKPGEQPVMDPAPPKEATNRWISMNGRPFELCNVKMYGKLHSLKLTARTWQEAGPQKETNLPTIHFQVQAVSFGEGNLR